ncbi:MAG: CoA pyrophosphatase [Gemmatimonadaceae bacterium]|nr:CoA pyrophosphatase [Gemmatimonadaceae bacterium]
MIDSLVLALRARVRVEEPEAEGLRWAAVALVLRGATVADASLLFIRRAERIGDPWSGHVAFPGGRRDASDATLEETARRETSEELSLDLGTDARLIGVLDDLRPGSAALPSIAVRPYVYALTREVALVPNKEVHSAFWLPLFELRDPARSAEHVFERAGARLRFPAYLWGEDVVWGMTERIVTQLLSVLFAP